MHHVRRKGSHDQLERALYKTCTGESLPEKTMEKMTVRIHVRVRRNELRIEQAGKVTS